MSRADYLRECIGDVGQMPLDTFQSTYCVRCGNRECQRNGAQNASFDRRVANWRSTMFESVPRAADDDPAFAHIRSKRFLPLVETVSVQSPPAQAAIPVSTEQVQPETPAPIPASSRQPLAEVVNTPFQQGMILPGGTADPAPAAPSETVVEAGGTFTFGGSDG